MTFVRLISTLLAFVIVTAANAQVRTIDVQFAGGSSGADIPGRIIGSEEVRYRLGASAGQQMRVDLATSNSSAYFNIFAPGDVPGQSTAMFIGPVSGTSYVGTLPAKGTYTIQVFLNRHAARRNETADYRLSVSIGGAVAPVQDFADSLNGGPDWWSVTGVSSGDTLNVRSGPSTSNPVVARVPNGYALRNMGCVQRSQRWCEVEAPDGRFAGWVAGRFLREGAAPSTASAAIQSPQNRPRPTAGVPEIFQRSTGELEVIWAGGCQVLYNPSGITPAGASLQLATPAHRTSAHARKMR